MPKVTSGASPITGSTDQRNITAPIAASTNVDQCSIICVVRGTIVGAPKKVLEHFESGNKSDLIEIDFADVLTRNWTYGQLAGAGAYIGDNCNWLRASSDEKTHKGLKLVKIHARQAKNGIIFYYSRYSKYNNFYGPGGFNPKHDRVMNIMAGAGSTSSTFVATAKGILGTLKGNALVSFVFGSATAAAEWKADVKKDGYDLACALLMSIVKPIVVVALSVVIVAGIIMFAMAAGVSAVPLLVIGVLSIAVGFVVNYGVEWADKALGRIATNDEKKSGGLSEVITPHLRTAALQVEESWNYLMNKLSTDYKELLF